MFNVNTRGDNMEIKFRVWDKKTNQMCKVGAVYFSDSFELDAISVHLPNGLAVIRSINDCIVMQSTGLKDKSGVEIYEGDVLTSNVQPCKMVNPIKDGYGIVRFENGMFKLGAISLATFISKMEVIGNIYECEDK